MGEDISGWERILTDGRGYYRMGDGISGWERKVVERREYLLTARREWWRIWEGTLDIRDV